MAGFRACHGWLNTKKSGPRDHPVRAGFGASAVLCRCGLDGATRGCGGSMPALVLCLALVLVRPLRGLTGADRGGIGAGLALASASASACSMSPSTNSF